MTNGFKIIGIATRTTNKDNQAQTDLGKLWGDFFAKDLMNSITNKCSNEILAIYTDYKSDFTEEYTTIIGMPVATLDEVPAGLVGREFPAENFQKFIARGDMPQAVVDVWMDVWNRDAELNRNYTYDYELYGAKSQNGAESEVEIFISVK
ncbi:GyrI-like domain-containing protein [Pedobacter frigoris]|uniref:AraC family transcriptional regulator n=1 Tax=Pedobacter frigoris TaxID=2571272 RepID=A0A4V5P1K5_9SPHI|nr:GyrI-like domain-containing protein [Pedobacter frigoris]TKC06928.1 AraC family transcriptional regulator [Pedobacter frigoris]